VNSGPESIAAAVAARRLQTKSKLDDVGKTIGQLRRERGRLTVRAIAARAAVSVTFLYENPEARALVQSAVTASRSRRDQAAQAEHDQVEATWRERALNAEDQLTRMQREVLAQRARIGELMGQLRDIAEMVPGDTVQQFVVENTTLKRRVQQLDRERGALQERLEAARSNLRFADKRVADLEAQLIEASPVLSHLQLRSPADGTV